MTYIGFNLEDDTIEKLKVISFITKKNRTDLIKEGIEEVLKKHADSFEKFNDYVQTMKK